MTLDQRLAQLAQQMREAGAALADERPLDYIAAQMGSELQAAAGRLMEYVTDHRGRTAKGDVK